MEVSHADRRPRRNAFPGTCRCGKEVAAKEGWIWKGGVYCLHPKVPNICPKNYN